MWGASLAFLGRSCPNFNSKKNGTAPAEPCRVLFVFTLYIFVPQTPSLRANNSALHGANCPEVHDGRTGTHTPGDPGGPAGEANPRGQDSPGAGRRASSWEVRCFRCLPPSIFPFPPAASFPGGIWLPEGIRLSGLPGLEVGPPPWDCTPRGQRGSSGLLHTEAESVRCARVWVWVWVWMWGPFWICWICWISSLSGCSPARVPAGPAEPEPMPGPGGGLCGASGLPPTPYPLWRP